MPQDLILYFRSGPTYYPSYHSDHISYSSIARKLYDNISPLIEESMLCLYSKRFIPGINFHFVILKGYERCVDKSMIINNTVYCIPVSCFFAKKIATGVSLFLNLPNNMCHRRDYSRFAIRPRSHLCLHCHAFSFPSHDKNDRSNY